MPLWEIALWGLGGASCLQALQIVTWLQHHHEKFDLWAQAVAVPLLLAIGTIVAVAVGATLAEPSPVALLVAGVTGPLAIQDIVRRFELDHPRVPAPPEPPPVNPPTDPPHEPLEESPTAKERDSDG